MNITHAAAIIFYELFKKRSLRTTAKPATKSELDRIYYTMTEIINLTRYPEHKKKNTFRMIKRIVGRAGITSWEYHILMGILNDVRERLNQCQKMPPP